MIRLIVGLSLLFIKRHNLTVVKMFPCNSSRQFFITRSDGKVIVLFSLTYSDCEILVSFRFGLLSLLSLVAPFVLFRCFLYKSS